MAAKSDKEKTSKKDVSPKASELKKPAAKLKKTDEDDELAVEDDETKLRTGNRSVSAKSKDDDNESEDDFTEIEEDDNSNSRDKDEDWDPDFDEFDLPKSSKKATPGRKSKDSEDDYKIDDEFRDLFGSKSSSKKYNEDDDY